MERRTGDKRPRGELVARVDAEGRLLSMNPAYCATFGWTEAELAGQLHLPFVHAEDRGRAGESLRRTLSPPHASTHEERALTIDGWRRISWASRAVLDRQGRIVEIVCVGRDVTPRACRRPAGPCR